MLEKKDFIRELEIVFRVHPPPTTREGVEPDPEFTEVTETPTGVILKLGVGGVAFGKPYKFHLECLWELIRGVWYVTSKSEDRQDFFEWLPGMLKYRRKATRVDPKQFLGFYRAAEVEFDWTQV